MENDIFLDIFTTTYSRVVDALAKKKKKMVNENFISKTRNNMRALGSLTSNLSNQVANDRGSGQNFFGPDNQRNKAKKLDRGALGSSMMSVSSNEERDSMARRTN